MCVVLVYEVGVGGATDEVFQEDAVDVCGLFLLLQVGSRGFLQQIWAETARHATQNKQDERSARARAGDREKKKMNDGGNGNNAPG